MQAKIDNIIAMGTKILGGFSFPQGLLVEGTVEGPVTAMGQGSTVLVGENGKIIGPIVSENVVIKGYVEGDIRCVHVSIKPGATVRGTIFTASMQIDKGAHIEGSCQSHPRYTPFTSSVVNDGVVDLDQNLDH